MFYRVFRASETIEERRREEGGKRGDGWSNMSRSRSGKAVTTETAQEHLLRAIFVTTVRRVGGGLNWGGMMMCSQS